jgi:hypothetical protein
MPLSFACWAMAISGVEAARGRPNQASPSQVVAAGTRTAHNMRRGAAEKVGGAAELKGKAKWGPTSGLSRTAAL